MDITINDCVCGNKHLTNTGQYGYGEKDVNFRQIVANHYGSDIWIECGKCGRRTLEYKTEENAITAWNNNHYLTTVYTILSHKKLKDTITAQRSMLKVQEGRIRELEEKLKARENNDAT